MAVEGTRHEEQPRFALEVPQGEDIVRVTWSAGEHPVVFALVPDFRTGSNGFALFDDAHAELRQVALQPKSGIDPEEILEHMSFTLEVPDHNANGQSNGVFAGKEHPHIKATTLSLVQFVDASITDDDFEKIVEQAKSTLLASRHAQLLERIRTKSRV